MKIGTADPGLASFAYEQASHAARLPTFASDVLHPRPAKSCR